MTYLRVEIAETERETARDLRRLYGHPVQPLRVALGRLAQSAASEDPHVVEARRLLAGIARWLADDAYRPV